MTTKLAGRTVSRLFLAALGALLLAALATPFSPAYAQVGRVAIVFATGGLGDQSFNDSAYAGVLRAEKELGIQFNYVEPTAIAEYETLLTRFAQTRRYDLIISIGFDQADALANVADRFPNQKFAVVDTVVDKPNIASFVYKEAERGFLVGAIAGLMTQRRGDARINSANAVGVVGGMDIPLINAAIAGYIAGAKFVNPSVDVRYAYVGDWADPARGLELTLAQIDQGVDVVWAAAGRSGLGAVQGAQERNRYVIWADSDRGDLAPENMLTSGLKLVDNTVYNAIKDVLAGSFATGIHNLGIADGGLGYSDGLVPADVKAQVDALARRVAAGEIAPPETIDAVNAWLAANRM